MKAKLILDMPRSCDECCLCGYTYDGVRFRCKAITDTPLRLYEYTWKYRDCRRADCPLVPVEESE